jgi:hypothetical protein
MYVGYPTFVVDPLSDVRPRGYTELREWCLCRPLRRANSAKMPLCCSFGAFLASMGIDHCVDAVFMPCMPLTRFFVYIA